MVEGAAAMAAAAMVAAVTDPALSPEVALTRLQHIDLTLSGGRSLEDWLAKDTSLGPDRAAEGITQYRRFLALALTATPEAPVMASPLIAQIWRAHRADGAAWSGFLEAVAHAGCDPAALTWRPSRHTVIAAPSYPKTRARLRAAFGSAPAYWWPSRLLMTFAGLAEILSETRQTVFICLIAFGPLIWPQAGWSLLWILAVVVTLVFLLSQVEIFWPQRFTVPSEAQGSLAGPA